MSNIVIFPNSAAPKTYLRDGNALCFAEYPIDGDIYYRPINERAQLYSEVCEHSYLSLHSINKARRLGLLVLIYDQDIDTAKA